MTEKTEKGHLSVDQVRKDLSIDDNNLDGCMTEQAGLYAYYAAMYVSLQHQADRAKIASEVARAKTYKRHRNRLIARGTKFSEAMLDAEVNSDDEYIDAQNIAAKYRMRSALAKESLEAFKQRRDMLVQKGVAKREEMKGELYVKSKEASDAELRDKARRIASQK